MIRSLLGLIGLVAVGALAAETPAPRAASGAIPPGLYVNAGVMMKAGQPYRGIGANYFSLFARILKNPKDASPLTNLTALAQARIPFVRFMCGGFWPADQPFYVTNRAAYFERLDRVVRSAETNGIGLIPSLFWNPMTVPDVVGEHQDEYGNPNSKTLAFIRRYTEEVVRRYQDSPAIWGWEFGNEYNLACDLPNASQHRPAILPHLGTALTRSARDELKFAQLRVAVIAFAETVRKFDPTRILVSGNSSPRASAWHNVQEKSWTSDTYAQFCEILLRDNPDPMDTLTVHIYPDHNGAYAGGAKNIADAIGVANRVAVNAHKPLFLGEFGTARQRDSREQEQAEFQELLDAIIKHGVPLSAFWVFDLDHQEKDWNVSFRNDRAYMINLVAKANERLRVAGK